jgi:hypothetical protein
MNEKMSRGKGTKKNINGSDFLSIIDNPPPEGRVELLAQRYKNGLDIWTGQRLKAVLVSKNDNQDTYLDKYNIPKDEMESLLEIDMENLLTESEDWELEDTD